MKSEWQKLKGRLMVIVTFGGEFVFVTRKDDIFSAIHWRD